MPDQMKSTNPLSDLELDVLIHFLRQKPTDSPHLGAEEFSAYLDIVQASGEEAAAQRFPELATHFAMCDTCLAERFLMEEVIRTSQPTPHFEPDLSFLKKPANLWRATADGIWQLLETIHIQVKQASLSLQAELAPVRFSPVTAYATRREDSKTVKPVELSIKWPQSEWTVQILLVGAAKGQVQCLLLGIEQAGIIQLEGITANIKDISRGDTRQPEYKKGRALDFGLFPTGQYRMTIKFGVEQIEFPLEFTS